jgi:hypothetical protein
MKCKNPNVTKLQSRAVNFVKYASKYGKHGLGLPRNRPYRLLPVTSLEPLLQMDQGWIDVAINNSGVAATPVMHREDWRISDLLTRIHPFPDPHNKCVRLAYDDWFDKSATALAERPFGTYGRAQKFLNLYVKYPYCIRRSGATVELPKKSSFAQVLDFECALHAPIDSRVLKKLCCIWRQTNSWSLVRPIICKAWSKMNRNEYWQILWLLRNMVNTVSGQTTSCGNYASNSLCICNVLHTEIPQTDFAQAVLAALVDRNDDDPIVSVLDLEMRGLWNP